VRAKQFYVLSNKEADKTVKHLV